MSKYIPPSLRNKNSDVPDMEPEKKSKYYRKRNNYTKPQWEVEKDAAEKAEKDKRDAAEKSALENTEENFPSLSRGAPKSVSWGGRKFSELATEWKSKADEDATIKQVVEKDAPVDGIILPKFNNVHRFHEPEEKAVYKQSVEEKNSDDEWKTIRRKVYVPKKNSVEDEIREEEEKLESDDTVWATEDKEEHETCWDERRY